MARSFARAFVLSGAALAATASLASAQAITGPYETNGQVTIDGSDDFTITHNPTSFPAGSSLEFVPSSPVTFGDIGSVSFDYEILGGTTGGGVPRIFFELNSGANGYAVLRPDYDPAFGDTV